MLTTALDQWRFQFFEDVESLRIFEVVFDKLPDVLYLIKDRQGRYVSVNNTCMERFNLPSREAAIGKTANDLFPAHMAKRYNEQDEQVLRTGLPLTDSLDLTLYADRSHGWCVSNKFPLHNKKGQVIGLIGISQDIAEPSRDGLIDKDFADTVDYIRLHHGESLRMEDLADKANLSPTQFERRMKKIFQLTPSRFILKSRIDTAANLLLNSEMTVAQISLQVGFCDQSALSRQFRHLTGLSPVQYRQLRSKKLATP